MKTKSFVGLMAFVLSFAANAVPSAQGQTFEGAVHI